MAWVGQGSLSERSAAGSESQPYPSPEAQEAWLHRGTESQRHGRQCLMAYRLTGLMANGDALISGAAEQRD